MSSRVVVPKVNMQLFRPIIKKEKKTVAEKSGFAPKTLVFKKVLDNIDQDRIKGIALEETALFGGFVEVNIAEDPTSDLFDRFLPNDHMELFYDDTNTDTSSPLGNIPLTSFNLSSTDDKLLEGEPKFSGATWKGEIETAPSVVTTKINAWDYLRLLQYYNIPRGEGKTTRVHYIEARDVEDERKYVVENTEVKYRNDFLDYVDHAVEVFIGTGVASEVTVYGATVPTEVGVRFVDVGKFKEKDTNFPSTKLYYNGFGSHCTEAITRDFKDKFQKLPGWDVGDDSSLKNAIDNIEKAIDGIGNDEIRILRLLDGEFGIAASLDDNEAITADMRVYMKVDIVVIDRLALIKLILNSLTIDHGLNLWFTPVFKPDPDLVKFMLERDAELFSDSEGNRLTNTKLVYCKVQQGNNPLNCTRWFNFNMDTYAFNELLANNLYKSTMANIKRLEEEDIIDKFSKPDLLSLIFASSNFPQKPPPPIDGLGNWQSIFKPFVFKDQNQIESHKTMIENILGMFDITLQAGKELSTLNRFRTEEIGKASAAFSIVIHRSLRKDDKIVSAVQNIPASYARADIYTGSKFKMHSYDSLPITRIIQIIMSTSAGMPHTNDPQTNTQEGKIDSYAIFAANRIVIRPKVKFGTWISKGKYKLYSSMTKLMKLKGNDEVRAAMFVIIEVGRKSLVSPDKTDFEIDLSHVHDFSIKKGSSINHHFNLSIGDHLPSYRMVLDNLEDSTTVSEVAHYLAHNGIFLEYRENGVTPIGISPPEFVTLTLTDMTQNDNYSAWRNRVVPNYNTTGESESEPPINPHDAYISNATLNGGDIGADKLRIGNWTVRKTLDIDRDVVISDFSESLVGLISYVDIEDIRREMKNLLKVDYKDIVNSDQHLFDNIYIRTPMKIEVKNNVRGKKAIFIRGVSGSGRRTLNQTSLKKYLTSQLEELEKITNEDMKWLFPYAGFKINTSGNLYPVEFSEVNADFPTGFVRNMLVVAHFDLLMKGVRYILWSIQKSRMFAHAYMPIEYQKYVRRSGGLGLTLPIYLTQRVEPGSSILFVNNERSTLSKSLNVSKYKITGLDNSEDYYPLIRTVNRGKDDRKATRTLVWYVSKKVTYIGADVGAMMRIELTEGSLDWTLFFNEKNLLTQISEHYLMNGIRNTSVY
jgi:hypothetical protein